jgi:hypothetical protein
MYASYANHMAFVNGPSMPCTPPCTRPSLWANVRALWLCAPCPFAVHMSPPLCRARLLCRSFPPVLFASLFCRAHSHCHARPPCTHPFAMRATIALRAPVCRAHPFCHTRPLCRARLFLPYVHLSSVCAFIHAHPNEYRFHKVLPYSTT